MELTRSPIELTVFYLVKITIVLLSPSSNLTFGFHPVNFSNLFVSGHLLFGLSLGNGRRRIWFKEEIPFYSRQGVEPVIKVKKNSSFNAKGCIALQDCVG